MTQRRFKRLKKAKVKLVVSMTTSSGATKKTQTLKLKR